MQRLRRLLILSPFGVYPPRSGGHLAILEPAKIIAKNGVDVWIFGLGIRRFEAFRHFRPFVREIQPGLMEYRHVSIWNWIDYLKRGRTGLPGLNAAGYLKKINPVRLEEHYRSANIIQYESPWLFAYQPVKKPRLFTAHNVEAKLIEDNIYASPKFIQKAIELEKIAWDKSEKVICFTAEDRKALSKRYGQRDAAVIPMGVNTDLVKPPLASERMAARRRLGVMDHFVVLFTGSWHLPNRKALSQMLNWSKRTKDKELLFVVAGSVGNKRKIKRNFWVTGYLPDLSYWYQAADCCLNPITEGSGANVKLVEYLAWGIPVITTPFGTRGIEITDGVHALIRNTNEFYETLIELKQNGSLRSLLGAEGRRYIERNRSWTAITNQRLKLIESLL